MKKWLLLAGISLFLLIIISISVTVQHARLFQAGSCQNISEKRTVEVTSSGFSPNTISVKTCAKITFQNIDEKPHWPASDYHPTHGVYPEFDPQIGIEPGKSWSFVFDVEGSWKFHDHLSPRNRGVITVNN